MSTHAIDRIQLAMMKELERYGTVERETGMAGWVVVDGDGNGNFARFNLENLVRVALRSILWPPDYVLDEFLDPADAAARAALSPIALDETALSDAVHAAWRAAICAILNESQSKA